MTTIFYRDGILAAESRVATDTRVISDTNVKIDKLKLKDGSYAYVGSSGSFVDGLNILKNIKTLLQGKDAKYAADGRALVVHVNKNKTPKIKVYIFEENLLGALDHKEAYAIGSGEYFAMGASAIKGTTIVDIMRAAVANDHYSGGNIVTVDVMKKKLTVHKSS